MRRSILKTAFFTFGPKQFFYLTHSAREYFEKLTFKKQKKCNFKRLYLKDWGKFRQLIFSEILFNFLENKVVFCTLYPLGTRQRAPHPTTLGPAAIGSPGSKSEWWGSKTLKFALLFQSHFEMRRNYLKTVFFDFWTKAMLLLNPVSTRTLWKICI